jgi:hypothetical protein
MAGPYEGPWARRYPASVTQAQFDRALVFPETRLGLRVCWLTAATEKMGGAELTGERSVRRGRGRRRRSRFELTAAYCWRVLRPGGRFGAVEPWIRSTSGGSRLISQREGGMNCRPMTSDRARPLCEDDDASVVHHGALTRYPLLASAQLGRELRPPVAHRVTRLDDACSTLVGPKRDIASCTVVLDTRGR